MVLGKTFPRLNLNNKFISSSHLTIKNTGTKILLLDGTSEKASRNGTAVRLLKSDLGLSPQDLQKIDKSQTRR